MSLETLKILHGDISIGNILLHRSDENMEANGLLIDFDFARTIKDVDDNLGLSSSVQANDAEPSDVPASSFPSSTDTTLDISDEGSTSVLNVQADNAEAGNVSASSFDTLPSSMDGPGDYIWTGTPPFVAIEALLRFPKHFKHQPCLDLESILYVILYFCTYFKGPGSPRIPTDFPDIETIPLRLWFQQDDVKQIGRHKMSLLVTPKRAILAKFTPYWDDFKPFVHRLITSCFPKLPSFRCRLTHEGVLEILQDAYQTVQEPLPESSHEPLCERRQAKRPKLTHHLR